MAIKVYRSYNFIDKDPIVDAVRTIVQDTGLNYNKVSQISGVAGTTLHNWFDGPTKRPNNATVSAVTSSLGFVRRDRLDQFGRLHVHFVRARTLDFEHERAKALNWASKQNGGTRKRRRQRKPNGSGSIRM
jgi:hypothetical protein